MDVENILRKAGLSEKEARIFLELARIGPINANVLSKRLGIERTVVYNTLNKLIEKGIVSSIVKERKKLFRTADPENLLRPIKEKEELIKSIVPEIRALQKEKPEETIVEVYEGKEALKTLYNLAIKTKEDILIFGGTGKAYEELPLQIPHLEKEAVRKKLHIRAIFNYSVRRHKFTKLPIVKSKYLPKKNESKITTSIIDKLVAIHILINKPFIIIIKNEYLAESYRNLFEFLWEHAFP